MRAWKRTDAEIKIPKKIIWTKRPAMMIFWPVLVEEVLPLLLAPARIAPPRAVRISRTLLPEKS